MVIPDKQETEIANGQPKPTMESQDHEFATDENLERLSPFRNTNEASDTVHSSIEELEDTETGNDAQCHTSNVSSFENLSELFIPDKPTLIKYTEGISGSTKEILLCTADAIAMVLQTNPCAQQSVIIQSLLSRSTTYSGKPVHIIFDPRNVIDVVEEGLVPLHPSPGRHNLLHNISTHEVNIAPDSNRNANTASDHGLKCSEYTHQDNQTSSSNAIGFETLIPLYPSPGRHNLLHYINTHEVNTTPENNRNVNAARDSNLNCSEYSDQDTQAKPSNAASFETLIPLHPSPGRYNLLHNINTHEEDIIPDSNLNTNVAGDPALNCLEYIHQDTQTTPKNTDSCVTLIASQQQNKFPSDIHPGSNLPEQSTERKKLKIRSCRREKSRTALKRVDIKQIVSSVFRNFFHFYAMLGGHLKSGSVITKSSSNFWLREAGVAEDAYSLETASDLFMAIAGTKVVLNIFDYLQFLIAYARRRKIATIDLLSQLTVYKLPRTLKNESQIRKTRRRTKKESSNVVEQETMFAHRQRWFQSLPNL